MQLRKGLAQESAFQLVLVAMVGGVVMMVVGGPMLSQIEVGFNQLGELTTSTTLNVSNEDQISQAALYVYQRASNDGCTNPDNVDYDYASPTVPEQIDGVLERPEGIDENGYPALADTFLSAEPPCTATEAATGRDMEGTYSRVEFVIDETEGPIVLGDGGSWLDNRVKGARKANFYDATRSECSQDIFGSAAQAGAAGALLGAQAGGFLGGFAFGTAGFIAGATGETIAGARFVGTGKSYVVFFPEDAPDSRSDAWLTEAGSNWDFSNRIYCYAMTDSVLNADLSSAQLQRSPLDTAFQDAFGGSATITLCPGDRGYIQMNKDYPQNDGEASEGWGGSAYNYPFIQITQLGESC